MRPASKVALATLCMCCLALCLCCLALPLLWPPLHAEDPATKVDAGKPPWQRLLEGEEATKAAEQEKQLDQLQEAGHFAEALKVAEALTQLRTKRQGADHWQVADARSAAEAIRRVLRANPQEQENYRRSFALHRQAEALRARGRSREAQPLWEQILAIRRRVLGDEHTLTAFAYEDVARSLSGQGKYAEAEEGCRKALAIWRKVLGEEHPDTAAGYNNVAATQSDQGKYQEAERGFRRALAISRKVQGEVNPAIATTYNAMALTLIAQGKTGEAEECARTALALRREVLGEEHADTARSYNSVAMILHNHGKYREAEEGFRKVLAIYRKALGDEHPNTATAYNNVAVSLDVQGKHLEAEVVHARALAIRRKVLGERHPYTAQSYNNLADNHYRRGRYAEAEEGYRKSLDICYTVMGKDHPRTAEGYNNVATSLSAQGKHAEAEDSFRKALAINRKALGEESLFTARSYANVARNLNARGQYTQAEEYGCRAAASFAQARLHAAASGLGRASTTSQRSPLPALAALLARNGKPSDAWQRFEESLARGTWDDMSARLRRPAREQAKQAQLVGRIDSLNKRIEGTFSAKEPTPQQAKHRQELLAQLRQAQENLAVFMHQLEQAYGPVAGQVSSRADIQASLPADAALVGWLDLPGQAKATDPDGEHWAVLLRSAGAPTWVRLQGSGARQAWTEADTRLPGDLRLALQSPTGDWQPLAQRLRQQRLQPLLGYVRAGNGLPALRRLIVLPSTALAGVPIEVIAEKYSVSYAHSGTMHAFLRRQATPATQGLFALADPVFELPTDRDRPPPLPPGGVLLTAVIPGANAAQAGLRPNDVLLRYGDTDLTGQADFKPHRESDDPAQRVPVVVWRDGKVLPQSLSVRPGNLGLVLASQPAPEALAEQRRLDRRLAARGGDEWSRLPGTRCEAASLQRLFGTSPVQVLLDSHASEQRVTEMAGQGELGKYRYVHLATHGEVDNTFPLRSALILSRDQLPDPGKQLEAGLPIYDGRLTAEEVLRGWHLDSELVTLSACQTALGKYEEGEGFVGFAQALILAGSRSVCLSLWKVDDTATALLMERFYQNLLGKRAGLQKPLGKAEALAEAKAWLRRLSRQEAVKRAADLSKGVDRGKGRKVQPLLLGDAGKDDRNSPDLPFAHPYYWAAFVLIGQPE